MAKPRIYTVTFAAVYPMYVQKVERKGRTVAELDEIICWLTGYDEVGLKDQIAKESSLEEFIAEAPEINQASDQIKGLICGIRVENIEDYTTQKIRYMDKIVDELAKGKTIDKIKRQV